MNDVLIERHKEGLEGLRMLLLGKHLRPRQLALMVAAFVAEPERAMEMINEQEVANG